VTGCAGDGAWALRGRAGAGRPGAPLLESACRSRRVIAVTVRGVRRAKLRRVTVRLGDGRARRVRARRRVRVDLRGRPKGTVVVRLVAVTRAGRRSEDRRVYRLCAPKRRG